MSLLEERIHPPIFPYLAVINPPLETENLALEAVALPAHIAKSLLFVGVDVLVGD
nr:MAG TPA: hypothetical protein [Caudoviricetes sp.]